MKKVKKTCQNGLEPWVVPQVPQNKWFGEGTKRAFPRWCQFLIKILWKITLSIFKFWWENPYEIKNSGFRQQWFFRPILTETYILLYDLHHLLESMSFKKPSRSAAAVQKVHSYPGEKQNCQNACIARDHAKNQFLTTSPGRERDSCLPIKTMDFPKSHVLKRLVNIMVIRGLNHQKYCTPRRRNSQQQKARFRRS